SSSMSLVTIVIFSELRSVSVGSATGLGWVASARNVRAQPSHPIAPKKLIDSSPVRRTLMGKIVAQGSPVVN
ncbi:MAG TPA: hypothetical protein VGD80_33200, partial [Kofleriaceae bacterium]